MAMLWREMQAPWGKGLEVIGIGGVGAMLWREMQGPWEKGWKALVVLRGWCGVRRGEAFILACQAPINTANPDKRPC